MRRLKYKIYSKLKGDVSVEELIENGLRVGKNFNKLNGCIIDFSHCWLIDIGNDVTLAPRVTILAHDASTKMFLGFTKIGRVKIGNNVFIGAGSIILPNVTIGNNVIIGAGSIVTKDIESNCVVAGNPATMICTLDEYLDKQKAIMKNVKVFDKKWTISEKISNTMKDQMRDMINDNMGFIE